MVFSDTTNKNGIIQKIELLLNFADGQISGDGTLLKQFTALINDAYNEVTARILELNSKWRWDDAVRSNFPRAYTNLVASQRDYALPVADTSYHSSSLLTIEKIAVLDASGEESILRPTNLSEAELNEMYPSDGLPIHYKLVGQSAKIWPAANSSNTTLTNGFIVYYTRIPHQFASDDTTKQPGFAAPFHQILAYKAAFDYGAPKNLPNLEYLQSRIQELYEGLKDLYTERNKDDKNVIIPRSARETYN